MFHVHVVNAVRKTKKRKYEFREIREKVLTLKFRKNFICCHALIWLIHGGKVCYQRLKAEQTNNDRKNEGMLLTTVEIETQINLRK